MMFYEKLQNATAEENVKTAYIKALGLKNGQRNLIDIQTKEVWFEAKFGSRRSVYFMFTQLLNYVWVAIRDGEEMGKDGAQYQTKSPTVSGWRIILSVKRLKGGGCFFKMEISRRRFVSRKDTPMPEVELALP